MNPTTQGQATQPNFFTDSLSGLNFSGSNVGTKPTTSGLNSTSLFGTGVQFGTDSSLKLQGTEPKTTGNFFTNLINGLGFGGTDLSLKEKPVTPQGEPTEKPEDEEEEDGTIVFTINPSKTYAKGETLKVNVTKKPKPGTNDDFSF
jgi:hypothetical protein